MRTLTVEESLRSKLREKDEQIDILREEVRQLKAMLLPKDWEPPVEFKLTAKETLVLSVLYNSDTYVKTNRLIDILYGLNAECDIPEYNTIQVFICKIRKKISHYGIVIETINGRGYLLTPESKQILANWKQRVVEPA